MELSSHSFFYPSALPFCLRTSCAQATCQAANALLLKSRTFLWHFWIDIFGHFLKETIFCILMVLRRNFKLNGQQNIYAFQFFCSFFKIENGKSLHFLCFLVNALKDVISNI